MAYYKHHIYLNNGTTLHIDSEDKRPKSTSTLVTIEEKDTKDFFTIPLAAFMYIKTEIIDPANALSAIDRLQLPKQDPYNGIVLAVKEEVSNNGSL